jgi:hypothetical protein
MVSAKPTEHRFGLRLVFHSIGIGCLAGSVFLQFLVFLSISTRGAFMGIEKNPLILNTEIGLTVFCAIYLLYVSSISIRSILQSKK